MTNRRAARSRGERKCPAGPRIGIYRKGRAEYSMALKRLSSCIRIVSKIDLSVLHV